MYGDSQIRPCGFVEEEQSKHSFGWPYHLSRLIPILAVYVSLALFRIDHQSLWTDEVISATAADPDGSFLNPQIWLRGQGPFYFVLLHLWAKLSTSDSVLRFLSVLIGCPSVLLIYALGIRLFNPRVAWIGTAMFATSPFFIWYSQEVRYITLMITASLFSMYVFHQGLSSNRLGWWVSYFCSLILAVGAFISNIILPVAQWLFLLRSPSRRQVWRKVLVSQILFLALFIWWANGCQYRELGGYWEKLFRHRTTSSEKRSFSGPVKGLVTGGDREFEVGVLPYTFFALSTGFSIGPSVRELQVSRSVNLLKRYLSVLLVIGVFFCSLFVSGLVALWRRSDTGLYLILWLAIPIAGALMVSAVTAMAYNVRYVAMVLPAYILTLAAGITRFRRPFIHISLLVAVLLVHGFSLANYYFDPFYAREDARSAAQYLESAASPRDIILVVGSKRGLRYYYKGQAQIVGWRGEATSDEIGATELLSELSQGHDRLWLVLTRPWEQDPTNRVKAALDETYDLVEHREFPGVQIYSYDLSNRSPNLRN